MDKVTHDILTTLLKPRYKIDCEGRSEELRQIIKKRDLSEEKKDLIERLIEPFLENRWDLSLLVYLKYKLNKEMTEALEATTSAHERCDRKSAEKGLKRVNQVWRDTNALRGTLASIADFPEERERIEAREEKYKDILIDDSLWKEDPFS